MKTPLASMQALGHHDQKDWEEQCPSVELRTQRNISRLWDIPIKLNVGISHSGDNGSAQDTRFPGGLAVFPQRSAVELMVRYKAGGESDQKDIRAS